VLRGRLVNSVITEVSTIVDNIQGATSHDGGRLKFGPDGKLYLTVGDATEANNAQILSTYAGKILRFNDDGTVPSDNPFGSPVWTWGHRHPQGIGWHHVSGDLWSTEHGATGNDELNRIVKGSNYGWPVIEGAGTRPDMVTPVVFFSPSVAPSGLTFYDSARIPQFTNNIFFATLAGMHIRRVRLTADGSNVQDSERLFDRQFGRIRDVITGPDGLLYFCTSNREDRTTPVSIDRIARIVPLQ
jgi:glucose/arabinose dehydrogenase